MSNRVSPLKPLRRIVTGHNAEGKSIVVFDDEPNPVPILPDSQTNLAARLWVTKETPVDNSDQTTDAALLIPDRLRLVQSRGSHASLFDVAPGADSPMHRTSSIDYVILISGQITLILDNGVETTITEPGSIIVQRGTIHGWVNRGSEWTRLIVTLIDAIPVEAKGNDGIVTPLPEKL